MWDTKSACTDGSIDWRWLLSYTDGKKDGVTNDKC